MGVRKTLLMVLGSEVAAGADFNKGLEAYFSGDYQTALSEWSPPAKRAILKRHIIWGYFTSWGKAFLKMIEPPLSGIA
jgi:hypothetical protein|tara:strand:- start:16 stop:249 length:234 start_codon:yes stop_codon:yes gene_type:complete